MFPWTSDDGFAVVDHREVNPALGTWADVAELAERPRADVRLRRQPHLEQQPVVHRLAGPRPGATTASTSSATRTSTTRAWSGRAPPRSTTPTRAPTARKAWAWTTFGEDQVDVDVRHPRTLLELTDVLLGYLARGASAVRLDAIGFLWKESGTTVPAPAADPRGHQAVAGARRPRRAGRAAADRDQRAAPREHLLLRRRPRRGPPRLPVRPAAAGAALVRGRVDGAAERLGRGGSARSATPRRGSTSWPATTASGCAPPRASSTTTSATALVERTRAHGGEVSWASRPDGTPHRLRAQPRPTSTRCAPSTRRTTPRSSRPRRSPRTASCSPSWASRRSTTTRWSARRPTSRAW